MDGVFQPAFSELGNASDSRKGQSRKPGNDGEPPENNPQNSEYNEVGNAAQRHVSGRFGQLLGTARAAKLHVGRVEMVFLIVADTTPKRATTVATIDHVRWCQMAARKTKSHP